MNEAFIQHAQHEVDNKNRNNQQYRKSADRVLESLRRALEGKRHRVRHANLARGVFYSSRGLAQSYARPQIEREVHGGKLPDVVYAERRPVGFNVVTAVSGTILPVLELM